MPNLNKHVKQITVELTCNALSHVDEILLDNKAEETNKNDDTLCSFDDGAIFQQCEQTTCFPTFSNAQMVVMTVVMMMHVAMRREGAPTQTTTCSMIICEQKKHDSPRHVSKSWGTVVTGADWSRWVMMTMMMMMWRTMMMMVGGDDENGFSSKQFEIHNGK